MSFLFEGRVYALEEDVSYIQTIYDLIEEEGKDFQKRTVLEKLKDLIPAGRDL